MEYVTPKDKAAEWGITQRRVEILRDNGRENDDITNRPLEVRAVAILHFEVFLIE